MTFDKWWEEFLIEAGDFNLEINQDDKEEFIVYWADKISPNEAVMLEIDELHNLRNLK